MGCFGLVGYSIFMSLCSGLIERFELFQKYGIRNWYILAYLALTLSCIFMFFFPRAEVVLSLICICGACFAVLFTIPLLLLSQYHANPIYRKKVGFIFSGEIWLFWWIFCWIFYCILWWTFFWYFCDELFSDLFEMNFFLIFLRWTFFLIFLRWTFFLIFLRWTFFLIFLRWTFFTKLYLLFVLFFRTVLLDFFFTLSPLFWYSLGRITLRINLALVINPEQIWVLIFPWL